MPYFLSYLLLVLFLSTLFLLSYISFGSSLHKNEIKDSRTKVTPVSGNAPDFPFGETYLKECVLEMCQDVGEYHRS